MLTTKPNNVDEYIAAFPEDIQEVLKQVRTTIKEAAPGAEELISYAMPAYKLDDAYIVYFAAFKSHIGFYALPSGNEKFKKELLKYKTGKGSIQFPLDEQMPLDLVTKMVKYRIKENAEKAKKKKLKL